MDNETEVQVVSGLDSTDVVVTGYTQMKKSELKKSTTEKSPFLPQRRPRTTKRGNTTPPPH